MICPHLDCLNTQFTSAATFDWDDYLSDKSFSRKLVNNIIPHLFKAKVIKVFAMMDHVTCFSDLENNFKILSPEDIVELFPSRDEFNNNLGEVVVVTMIPQVIQECKNNVSLHPIRSEQLKRPET